MTETDDIVARLRKRLGGVQIDAMQGDNLAITLCSSFDDPDEEVDDETCWGASAISGCTATLDAIHEHYAGAIARLEERCAALTGQVEAGAAEIERLTQITKINAVGLPYSIGFAEGYESGAQDLHKLQRRAEAAERENAALKEEVGRLREVLKTARSALVLAFSRIHALPRTADTELAKLIGEVLAKISTALKNQEPKP